MILVMLQTCVFYEDLRIRFGKEYKADTDLGGKGLEFFC